MPAYVAEMMKQKAVPDDVAALMHRTLIGEGHEPGDLIYNDIIDLEIQSYGELLAVDYGKADTVKDEILDFAAALYPDNWTSRLSTVREEIETFVKLADEDIGDVRQAYLEHLKEFAASLFPADHAGPKPHFLTVAPHRRAARDEDAGA